jgi:4-hydroxy-tetrahydrodipicolinate synthase
MVTPLSDPDTLDVRGLNALIEHLIDGGVHGLFVLGTTGEGPALPYRVRRELIDRTCERVGRRVPVLVGVTDTVTSEAVALSRHAAKSGADAVVSSAPYYYPLGQTELLRYFRTLAEHSPLPLLLYNMPAMTKTPLEIDLVEQAMEIESVVGVKDSSGDLAYLRQLCATATERRPDWTVLVGSESLLVTAMLLGAHGGVCGGSNLAPRLFVDLYDAANRGNSHVARQLLEQVMRLGQLYTIGRYPTSGITAIKYALSRLGLVQPVTTNPIEPFKQLERERAHAILDQLLEAAIVG